MSDEDKPLVWLEGEIKTPPFTTEARIKAGILLRRLQQGENIGMPHARPMPAISPRCYELRIRDKNRNWRIIFRIDSDAIVLVEVFIKKLPRHQKISSISAKYGCRHTTRSSEN